jgi:hypothetical protein
MESQKYIYLERERLELVSLLIKQCFLTKADQNFKIKINSSE